MKPRDLVHSHVYNECVKEKVSISESKRAAQAAQDKFDKGQFVKVQQLMADGIVNAKKIGKEKKGRK